MKNSHSLKSKLGDLILEVEIWLWAWAGITFLGMAAAIFFLRKASGSPELWGFYMAAKPLAFFGLGSFPVIPPDWFSPRAVIEYTQEKIPPALIDKWNSDFILITTYVPIASTLLLALLVFIFVGERFQKSTTNR